MQLLMLDICIVGAGSAGLSVAAGAAQLGADHFRQGRQRFN
jgi:flavin-dependent dehydrogenase